MFYSKDMQRQMEEIWRLTTTSYEGQQRLAKSSEPWLIENALRPDGTEVRVQFPDGRKKSDLPLWERKQRFIQARHHLITQAEIARSKASSWRDFHVGTALLAFRGGYRHEESFRVFTGMNIKHAENARPVCSEPIALAAAILNGYDLIIGMVVVGELNEGVKTKTLHPCKNCRWCMYGYMHEEDPALRIIDNHTIIHTALPSRSISGAMDETMSFKDTLALHREISGDEFV